ncbi:hypothetical protein MAR_002012 [Mya arenaria]|uniref:Uncharacterized protein n=1 Tax=Mya arenaria TaxID=6604 RepID=A0ABY7FFL1_MYAAR|nr:uncharacterized protein LOC128210007 [Mya arenaria]XP_052770263.1 uncharacterized protein LOC128210007 [Mya arenaria]WAR20174.1 hypothetical protein MAR_002012 [Mya arenaria]
MGCGSSSTAVKEIDIRRSPSAASSNSGARRKKQKRKSSSSSSSSSSSDDSRRHASRHKSHDKSEKGKDSFGKENEVLESNNAPASKPDENENIKDQEVSKVVTLQQNDDVEDKDDATKHEAEDNIAGDVEGGTVGKTELSHDELQAETFITGNYRRDEQDTKKIVNSSEFEQQEEEQRVERGFDPLTIPEMEVSQNVPKYTVLDIVEHNKTAGTAEWFRLGAKVYNQTIMYPIIEKRLNQGKEYFEYDCFTSYPPLKARYYGVTRRELRAVLAACHIGTHVPVPRDIYLASLLEGVVAALEELKVSETETEHFVSDFRDQLLRWKEQYPKHDVGNELPPAGRDPNAEPFPLPPAIMANPLVFQPWAQESKFDTELADDIWDNSPNHFSDLCSNSHEIFASQVAHGHDPEGAVPLDLTIDGAVAWFEVELDLVKNDNTTPEQDEIWQTRATRNDLDDEKRMERRRIKIGKILTTRHEWEPEKVQPFTGFANLLKAHWETFQNLCNQEWNPKPPKEIPDVSQSWIIARASADRTRKQQEPEGQANVSGSDQIDAKPQSPGNDPALAPGQSEAERLVLDGAAPEMETMDSGLDLECPDTQSTARSV